MKSRCIPIRSLARALIGMAISIPILSSTGCSGGNGAAGDSDGQPGADTDTNGDLESAGDPHTVGDTDYETDPALLDLRGACPLATRLGGFKVEANESVGYTAIDGIVRDGVVPSQVPLEALVEGDCKLLRRRRLVCDPACESDQTCGFDETCIPMPLGQDMGVATFRGLVKLVTIGPIQPGNTYFYSRLMHPGFTAGEVVQLTTTPGFMGALELYGVGVSQVVPTEETWVITEGQPLVIHWTPPPAGARSRLYLEINIDQHGITPLNLVCDLEDTGEGTISQALIDAFVQAGVTGFPSGKVTRRTADTTTTDEGCVEFFVTSVRQTAVEVTGHIPCTSDANCPEPLHCNLLSQQCE